MAHIYKDAKVSKNYSKYRPSYPKQLMDAVIGYCNEGGSSFNVCLDLGCGTGNGTEPLVEYYREVIGVDSSETQIEEARSVLPTVEFHVASADNLQCIEDNSIDLVTIAEALHWFPNWDTVYKEIRRILTKRGVVAAYFYIPIHTPQITEIFKVLHYGPLSQYTPKETYFMLDGKYKDIILPFADFRIIDDMKMGQWLTAADYVGFCKTLPTSQLYLQNNPDGQILEELYKRIEEMTGEKTILQEHSITLLMGRAE